MTGNAVTYHQNLTSDKKPVSNDLVEKDIRKWVESVVEFKAKLDQKKGEAPLEKHLKKNKKFKSKRKTNLVKESIGSTKNIISGQPKPIKPKRTMKKQGKQATDKSNEKSEQQVVDFFDAIKATYRNLKLPANWTSGLSNNRIVFNRIKVTTLNAQQKMAVERSLVITKDCNVHVLINGSEISYPNWEVPKITAIDDLKKAIKDIESLKLCEGPSSGTKSPQCSALVDSKQKICDACKSDTANPPKLVKKKPKTKKKTVGGKGVTKQKSFQK